MSRTTYSPLFFVGSLIFAAIAGCAIPGLNMSMGSKSASPTASQIEPANRSTTTTTTTTIAAAAIANVGMANIVMAIFPAVMHLAICNCRRRKYCTTAELSGYRRCTQSWPSLRGDFTD